MCVCLSVGLLVCLLFIGHTTFVHFAALPPRAGEQPSRRGRPRARAGKRMHSESTRVHAVQLLNEKIAALMPFKNKSVCARILSYTLLPRFSKRNPTCHFPSSVYSLPSLGVFTFRIVLNRILHKSSLLHGPHGITENQATYLHCGGEARPKKRARPPATSRKASTGKTGADTGPEGCGAPAVFPSPCLDLQRLQS